MEETTHHYTADMLEARTRGGHLYAIIDATAHSDVAGFAAELMHRGEGSAIPDLNHSELVTEDAVPYVLKMSPRFWRFLTSEIWPQNSKDSSKPNWGFFFEIANSHLDFIELVQHWRSWYFINLPQHRHTHISKEKNRAVFRYFDPRLTDAFLEVATEIETAAFFGPLSHLFLPQENGSACIYHPPILADEPEASDVRLRREFTMRTEHIHALELRRLEQRLPEFLTYLEKHFEDDFQRWQINDREKFIYTGLQQAANHGFLSERASIGWLSLQLLHGLHFANEQTWAINILNDEQHTVGIEDRVDRLIDAGFNLCRHPDKALSPKQ